MTYIEHHGSFARQLEHRINHWRALEAVELRWRAAKSTGEAPSVDHGEPSACASAGVSTGLGVLALWFVPETDGASLVLDALGSALGIGSASERC